MKMFESLIIVNKSDNICEKIWFAMQQNQSFLYDNDLRHERVNFTSFSLKLLSLKKIPLK